MIDLFYPYVPDSAKTEVINILNSKTIGQGNEIEKLEKLFENTFGYYTVAVNSCTSSLFLAYLLAGIKENEEVETPLFTCSATNIPLLWLKAKPSFMDIDKETLNPISKNKTRVKIGLHFAGYPLDDEFFNTNQIIVEDCAHYMGRPRGDFACYSFQAIKHITSGDGGMLLCKNKKDADKAKRLRWFGIDKFSKTTSSWEGDITEVGYKVHMTNINAVMAIEGFKKLNWVLTQRSVSALLYRKLLKNIPQVVLLKDHPNHSYWMFVALFEKRKELQEFLNNNEIECSQVHFRNDKYTIFKKYKNSFPNMDEIEDKYLALPLHLNLKTEDIYDICNKIEKFYAQV